MLFTFVDQLESSDDVLACFKGTKKDTKANIKRQQFLFDLLSLIDNTQFVFIENGKCFDRANAHLGPDGFRKQYLRAIQKFYVPGQDKYIIGQYLKTTLDKGELHPQDKMILESYMKTLSLVVVDVIKFILLVHKHVVYLAMIPADIQTSVASFWDTFDSAFSSKMSFSMRIFLKLLWFMVNRCIMYYHLKW